MYRLKYKIVDINKHQILYIIILISFRFFLNKNKIIEI